MGISEQIITKFRQSNRDFLIVRTNDNRIYDLNYALWKYNIYNQDKKQIEIHYHDHVVLITGNNMIDLLIQIANKTVKYLEQDQHGISKIEIIS